MITKNKLKKMLLSYKFQYFIFYIFTTNILLLILILTKFSQFFITKNIQ